MERVSESVYEQCEKCECCEFGFRKIMMPPGQCDTRARTEVSLKRITNYSFFSYLNSYIVNY